MNLPTSNDQLLHQQRKNYPCFTNSDRIINKFNVVVADNKQNNHHRQHQYKHLINKNNNQLNNNLILIKCIFNNLLSISTLVSWLCYLTIILYIIVDRNHCVDASIDVQQEEYNNNINNNINYDKEYSSLLAAARPPRIYSNEFAVHIPNGNKDVADRIAAKHGFVNIGQIGSLNGYYLFEHQHVHKRSLESNDLYHTKLNSEPEVFWVQQQHEKKRRKRDIDTPFPSVDSFFGEIAPSSINVNSPQIPLHGQPQSRSVSPRAFPDPLFKEQWYLNSGAKDGLDMNVGPAWQKGYTGKGVVVSILDDGIQTNHPDLALNYDPEASTDINGNDDDPMPQDNGDNKHGTRCAGEVAAIAFNQFCGIGIAYNASIGGVRMLDGIVNDAVEARALSLNPEHIDIYSASWGPEDDGKTVDGPGPLARRAFIYGVTSGRKGKGSIFVWASGNGGRHTDSCNCDGYTNSIFTLSISSATQGGYKPWYLEECSSTLASTYSSGTPGHDKSVATVDMDARLRPDHICTVEHTGTSASAPLAAGICALALEANPALTWRDMQYLVVLTSRAGPLEKETGWITNGVKRRVSHKFGYGLMDAGAMVTLAERWTNVPPQHICKSQEITEETPIDSTFGHALQLHMDVNGCSGTLNEVQYLEHVQCKITLRFFPRGNLRILLTSPMGTTSTLLFERPRDVTSSNFDDWPFLSVHFWGEKAEGRWTLQILNAGNRHVNQPGVLKKWQLIFYGTATNPIRLRQGLSTGGVQSLWKSPLNTFSFPTAGPTQPSTSIGDFFSTDIIKNFQNFPNIYSYAGSEPEQAISSLDDRKISRENVDEDKSTKSIFKENCDSECDEKLGCYGSGPSNCVACKNNKLDKTCIPSCPPRSYADETGLCKQCHESCATCIGPGQDNCVRCAMDHFRITDLDICMQQCPEGYFENLTERSCIPCGPNCGSCDKSPNHCTTCDHHLLLHDNKCMAACPSKMHETDDYQCASCDDSCATCRGPNATHCVTCVDGRYELNGKCLETCPPSFYADNKRKECMKCANKACLKCENMNKCLECAENWYLDEKGRCKPIGSDQCTLNQYYNGDDCQDCHKDCETCNSGERNSCLTCRVPQFFQSGRCVKTCSEGFYLENGRCIPCLHTCIDCVSRTNCTKCSPGLHLQTGQCQVRCASGYYSDRGICMPCHLSCATCSGPRADQCVTCPPTWHLAAGYCRATCPNGFYQNEYGCHKCHEFCKNCIGCKNHQGDKRRSSEDAMQTASGRFIDHIQFMKQFNMITSVAVIAGVCIIALFAFIFIILQHNTRHETWKIGDYSHVSIKKPKVTCHYNVVAVDDFSSGSDCEELLNTSKQKTKT